MKEKIQISIQRFDELGSTNDYAKEQRKNGKDLIVLAKRQTGGRGTKGRSFSSLEGGVYLSKLTFYQDFPAVRAFEIMSSAATAVCKTLVHFGVKPKIKWPNDIFVADKKICGILIENTFSGINVGCSVVGIGINVHNALPQELKNIATSLQEQTGKRFSVDEVADKLIEELCTVHTIEDYVSFIGYMGERARILVGEQEQLATLLSVDAQGGLWVLLDGKKQRFTSTEISVRI